MFTARLEAFTRTPEITIPLAAVEPRVVVVNVNVLLLKVPFTAVPPKNVAVASV